jgi:serine/threonine protein kinase
VAAHARDSPCDDSLGHEHTLNIEKVSFHNSYDLLGDAPMASGGFSHVWRCSRRGNVGAIRAVKIVNLDKLSQRGRRFLLGHNNRHGEIQLHQSLCHPHIVELMEVFHDSGVASLVMEYCHGGDLLEIVLQHRELHRTGLPEDGAARVMAHLCLALAYLHGNRIIHRDVKCENVLQMEVRGTALDAATFKLGDLGLAARLLKDQVLLEQVGSPSTSAPEVLLGRPHAMPADMWSAGATLFTMLAARRPWDGVTATVGKISLQGGCWEKTSDSVRNLVEQLLHPDPLLRISAEAALQHPWLREMFDDACPQPDADIERQG